MKSKRNTILKVRRVVTSGIREGDCQWGRYTWGLLRVLAIFYVLEPNESLPPTMEWKSFHLV